jgi:hypothetical protein
MDDDRIKQIDDLLRSWAAAKGLNYDDIVEKIEPGSETDSCFVRLRGDLADVEIVVREAGETDRSLERQIERKLANLLGGGANPGE